MTSFTQVPYEDILSFLRAYDRPISNDKIQNYRDAWNFLVKNNISEVPVSIADFVIALNPPLNIRKYSAKEIIESPNLDELSVQLNLPYVDKERIIRILGFLNLLINDYSVYEKLPKELLSEIVLNLDCKNIKLICQVSEKFHDFCDANLESILRRKIKTRLNISKYNKQQLEKLCQMRNTKYISAGQDHSLIYNSKGEIYSFGGNNYGQLGLGDNIDRNVPTLITGLNNIIDVSADYHTSLILNSDGEVYSCGYNQEGQLGLGDYTDRNVPTLIIGLSNIVQIIASSTHSLALNTEGRVYSFGANYNGQLGIGLNYNGQTNIPMLIPYLQGIIQISSKGNYSLALSNEGKVYAFGKNNFGQLGLGDYIDKYYPIPIPKFDNIVQISAGMNGSFMVNDEKRVYSFGYSRFRQSVLENNIHKTLPILISDLNNIVQVAAGPVRSLALNSEGNVYSLGVNYNKQLGLEHKDVTVIPTLIPKLRDIIYISVGSFHLLTVNEKGEVYSFGYNAQGQLGLGDNDNRDTPTPILNFNIYS